MTFQKIFSNRQNLSFKLERLPNFVKEGYSYMKNNFFYKWSNSLTYFFLVHSEDTKLQIFVCCNDAGDFTHDGVQQSFHHKTEGQLPSPLYS